MRTQSLFLKVYGALTRRFPADFRSAHGDDLVLAAADLVRANQRPGAVFLLRLLADLAARIVAEHVSDLAQDARYGARALAHSPGFTLAATACLGLGIGIATSAFTQFQASVFRSTPGVDAPESLVSFQVPVSFPDYEHYRDHTGQFQSAAAFLAPVPFVISAYNRPERIWGHLVTPDYFRVLGVESAAGRLFGPGEAKQSAAVAVMSHRLWESRFGRAPDLVGRTVRINGQPVTILGIAEQDFVGATPLLAVADLWMPTTAPARVVPELGGDVLHSPGVRTFQVVGRLKPGVTVAGAESALDSMARRLEQDRREAGRDREGRRITLLPGGRVFPIREQDVALVTAFPALIVSLILLIACANVATMLVARGAARQREIAIRLSIGAGRWRLVRQLLTESAVLALLGGAVGLLFVFWYHSVIDFTDFFPSHMNWEWQVDWRALLTALAVAAASALLFGLAPALQATRSGIVPALKAGAGFRLRAHRWLSLRNILVVQQMTASLTLLLLTAFIVLGFHRSKTVDLGFEPGNLFLLSIDPVRDGYSRGHAVDFFSKLPDRVRRIAGVRNAALAQSVPLGLRTGESVMATKMEMSSGPKLLRGLYTERVGAQFFETLGVPVLGGRTFRDTDQREDARVAVVNETMARETWPGQNAVGQTVELENKTYEIVGVTGDIRSGFAFDPPRRYVYLPVAPGAYGAPGPDGVTLLVRAERGVDAALLVRREIAASAPDLTVFNVTSMTEQVERMAEMFRVVATIYGTIGVFGLLLASVGLAGVTAYAVARRTHEIGIRRALGAQGLDVLRLVIKEGGVLIAAGTALGLAAAFAVIQVLSSTLSTIGELTMTSIRDPLLLAGAPLLLAALALLACYLPARRSLRISPVQALRAE
jgi:predicted permease